MKLSRQSFLDTVEYLCEHPETNTKNGTFWEALAFIQGLAIGSEVHGERGSHAGIQDFFHWLEVKKIGVDSSFRWFQIERFYELYSDDKTALKDFARYYREFCEGLPSEEDEIKLEIAESEAVELSNFLGRNKLLNNLQKKLKIRLQNNHRERKFLLAGEKNEEK